MNLFRASYGFGNFLKNFLKHRKKVIDELSLELFSRTSNSFSLSV